MLIICHISVILYSNLFHFQVVSSHWLMVLFPLQSDGKIEKILLKNFKLIDHYQFSSVQSLSHVQLFATP